LEASQVIRYNVLLPIVGSQTISSSNHSHTNNIIHVIT